MHAPRRVRPWGVPPHALRFAGFLRQGFAFGCMALVVVVLAGCNLMGGGVTSEPPTVRIDSPPSGTIVSTGREVEILSTAFGPGVGNNVERIDMYVNGELIRSDASNVTGGTTTFSVVQRWVPTQPGTADVKVIAYNVNGQPSVPAGITLTIQGEGLVTATATPVGGTPVSTGTITATATPTIPISQGTPAPVGSPPPNATTVQVFTATPQSTPGPGGAPVASPTLGGAITGRVTVTSLNVRSGPGTNFARLGALTAGTQVVALARNADSSWIQVQYGANQTGWVFSRYLTWSAGLGALPVR